MNRKNAFSYFMWCIYTMAVCVGLLGTAGNLSRRAGYSLVVGFGVSGLWLALCIVIVFLVHKLVQNMNSEKILGQMPVLVAESLIAVALFAVGIILRIVGLPGAGEDQAYYELAKIAEGQTIPSVVHGAVYIYLQLLHFIYFVFGNNFSAGIWLQIVLQMIAGFFFYRAVRKIAGVIASIVALGFIMVGPLMISESLSLSPEMLFLAIYAVVLYICIRCICGNKGLIACIITGVMISVVCYLDIIGVTLLLLMVAGLLVKKYEADHSLPKRFVGTLFCVLGCGLGFVLLMLMDSLVNKEEFGSVIVAWWEIYSPLRFMVPATLKITHVTVEILFLLLIMALGVFSYWCSFHREHLSLWTWMAIFLVLLQCFSMTTTEVNGYLHLYIVFAILAGVSMTGMFIPKEEIDNEEIDNEIKHSETTTESQKRIKSVVTEKPAETEAMTSKVQLLDNPLPLPKRHAKKVLDYDIKVRKGQDHFDLEVDENDDFDI